MRNGLKGTARRACLALAAAGVLIPAARAQAEPAPKVYRDAAQILKIFPKDTALVEHGVTLRLASGGWFQLTDNPIGKGAPTLCFYAPSLHVAGVCQSGPGINVTVLVDLLSGQRVFAPGLAMLMPETGLLAVGPDEGKGVSADSVTLVKVQGPELLDEGGAQFDDDSGPGGWVDGDCYRLIAKTDKGGGWLERTPAGWQQALAAQSKVCQSRHGH